MSPTRLNEFFGRDTSKNSKRARNTHFQRAFTRNAREERSRGGSSNEVHCAGSLWRWAFFVARQYFHRRTARSLHDCQIVTQLSASHGSRFIWAFVVREGSQGLVKRLGAAPDRPVWSGAAVQVPRENRFRKTTTRCIKGLENVKRSMYGSSQPRHCGSTGSCQWSDIPRPVNDRVTGKRGRVGKRSRPHNGGLLRESKDNRQPPGSRSAAAGWGPILRAAAHQPQRTRTRVGPLRSSPVSVREVPAAPRVRPR